MSASTVTQEHIERIKNELKEAGVSRLALHRFTSHYLPSVIHPDEHIEAAVFGRHKETEGLFGVVEGLLVATDKRILFIDHRPGFTAMDEISYNIVSGVHVSIAVPYVSLTLFTQRANYVISFARRACVNKFANYIEGRTVDPVTTDEQPASNKQPESPKGTVEFLRSHDVGVLSSIDRIGNVTGATVYYTMHNTYPYIMTKTDTKKAANILTNQHVAFTVFDEAQLQTVQIQGIIELETDDKTKELVSRRIIKQRQYESGSHLPPIMKFGGDNFLTFRIFPTKYSFTDYSRM